MTLQSIVTHIISEVEAQREGIIGQAIKAKEEIIQDAKTDAEKLYQELLDKQKAIFLSERQKLIVAARLDAKKKLLAAKQELIDNIFEKLKKEIDRDKFKKKQILNEMAQEVPEDLDFYFAEIRRESETEIAKILFG